MAMPELQLLQPAWLLLWPLGPALAWWLGRRLQWQSADHLFGSRVWWRHPAAPGLAAPAARPTSRLLPIAAWSCLLLALAQPVRLGEPLPGPRAPVDLYVLLDTSVSMVLTDYQQGDARVSRLDFAKGLLDRLAADYRGDRLGLYLLGSPTARLLPPSRDRALFRHTLARVAPVLAGRRAELGDALARLAADLSRDPAAEGNARERVVLLVTDGTQPSGTLSPKTGAERLRQAGIPLYILVTGARSASVEAGGAPSSLLFGAARPGQLEALAELTGGGSFPAADIGALQAAMDTLAVRHLSRHDLTRRQQSPLYPWLLLATLLCALAVRPTRAGP